MNTSDQRIRSSGEQLFDINENRQDPETLSQIEHGSKQSIADAMQNIVLTAIQ